MEESDILLVHLKYVAVFCSELPENISTVDQNGLKRLTHVILPSRHVTKAKQRGSRQSQDTTDESSNTRNPKCNGQIYS